jgi:hypothetical protein
MPLLTARSGTLKNSASQYLQRWRTSGDELLSPEVSGSTHCAVISGGDADSCGNGIVQYTGLAPCVGMVSIHKMPGGGHCWLTGSSGVRRGEIAPFIGGLPGGP